MIKLDIISDVACPWCYVGKGYLDRALEARPDHPFHVEWHPYQLNPELPPEGMDRQAYMRAKFGTQIEKTRDEYSRGALTELEAVQAELESVREQMHKAQNVLTRTEVLAPVSGTVIRLYYHTAGGVLASSSKLTTSQAPRSSSTTM